MGLPLVSLTSACSNGSDTTEPVDPGAPSAEGDTFPVTIDTALGEVTITAKPERVVTLGWGSQDVALALGVIPVGMQDMTGNTGDDTGILPWDTPLLNGETPELIPSSSQEIPLEQIASLAPDVILAVNSGLTNDQYAELTKIAPTVAYPDKPWLTSMQDQTEMVGKALGLSAEATALLEQTDELVAQAKADHPEFDGKTIAFGSGTTTDTYNVYLQSDSRVTLLESFGFTISPSLPTEAPSFAAQISLEELDTIDSDVLVAWYLSEEVQQKLETSPLFDSIPAVKAKGYVPLTDPAMVYATSSVTVLSLPWMLERYLPLLSAAANGESPLE